LERMDVAIVHTHAKLLVEVDEPRVERAMVGWRKRDSVSHMVNAFGRSHRKDMCSVH
jgi:hypothetical protein